MHCERACVRAPVADEATDEEANRGESRSAAATYSLCERAIVERFGSYLQQARRDALSCCLSSLSDDIGCPAQLANRCKLA